MTNRFYLYALALVALPASLSAADGAQIPEAPSSMLFALGVVGVLLGRHISRRRGNKPRD
jgi:hypothetical protein